MGNKVKGEVTFASGEKTYTLKFDANAICEIDEDLGEDFINTALADGKATRSQQRKIFWIVLRQRHPEIENEKQAGALVSYPQMIDLLSRAMLASQPIVDEGATTKNPQ